MRGSSGIEGGSIPSWSVNKVLRGTIVFFVFTSGFLGRFSNCVSLLERVDRIGVIGRASKYVGPIEGAVSRYPGYISCSANESLLRANNAPSASIFHLVVVDV